MPKKNAATALPARGVKSINALIAVTKSLSNKKNKNINRSLGGLFYIII